MRASVVKGLPHVTKSNNCLVLSQCCHFLFPVGSQSLEDTQNSVCWAGSLPGQSAAIVQPEITSHLGIRCKVWHPVHCKPLVARLFSFNFLGGGTGMLASGKSPSRQSPSYCSQAGLSAPAVTAVTDDGNDKGESILLTAHAVLRISAHLKG
jgi:hypothetical protein